MRTTSATAVAILLTLAGAQGVRAELNCNAGVEFHPGGGVRACVLNGDHRIYTQRGEPVSCADGRRAEQHPDGTLALCTLSRPARLGGQDCPQGAEVRFDAAGALERCAHARTG